MVGGAGGAPVETLRVTVEPTSTSLPAPGVWAITCPLSTVAFASRVTEAVSPAAEIAATAVASSFPTTEGTLTMVGSVGSPSAAAQGKTLVPMNERQSRPVRNTRAILAALRFARAPRAVLGLFAATSTDPPPAHASPSGPSRKVFFNVVKILRSNQPGDHL